MPRLLLTILTLLLGACLPCLAEEPETVHLIQSAENAGEGYNEALLKLALTKSGKPYRVAVSIDESSQLRRIERIKTPGEACVIVLGTSPKLETELLAVHAPIMLGVGSGQRILLTNKATAGKLKSVRTLEDLREFTFIQGLGWADVPILRAAGLRVEEVYKGELLYRMTAAGRVDLFPRGLFEIGGEYRLQKGTNPELVIDEHLLLTYPFAFYFFVGKDRQDLHNDILRGLEAAYESGEFQELLTSTPAFATALHEAKLEKRVRIDLPGHHVTQETREALDRFRFIPGKRPVAAHP
ncbi:hypothetical protein GM415_08350 [Pseudodesulfovibrio cashew]|uniref:Solute-binding protein family 3/N-terminal domain-containing protein n=1 Tax=Pseudodesulfovibrio cashew TaxID=2678688 RepID=A0A6I6JBI6_9BACT|nr:hypothetical protein [Pseudodesulfovibrio cashew]QGY40136.1 hypothetical protein GM415_08350 [Pseudodesulfovibrio cashew]